MSQEVETLGENDEKIPVNFHLNTDSLSAHPTEAFFPLHVLIFFLQKVTTHKAQRHPASEHRQTHTHTHTHTHKPAGRNLSTCLCSTGETKTTSKWKNSLLSCVKGVRTCVMFGWRTRMWCVWVCVCVIVCVCARVRVCVHVHWKRTVSYKVIDTATQIDPFCT